MKRAATALIALLLLTGCGGDAAPAQTTTAAPDTSAVPETTVEPETAAAAFPTLPDGASVVWENDGLSYVVSPENLPNDGILFVNHEPNRRSGHMGQAMVEYAPNKLLCFYPNCNAQNEGHSGRGWMEYKRSEDGGETWSDPIVLTHTKEVFDTSNQTRSVMAEKAVLSPDGKRIILFLLNCDVKDNALWEPYFAPQYIISEDGGETWSEPKDFCNHPGRVWDAMVIDDTIYMLMSNSGSYYLYVSQDQGDSFTLRSSIPVSRSGSFYGTLGLLDDGRFIVYTYHPDDEYKLEYVTSMGPGCYYWGYPAYAAFEKAIRNPQLACLSGSYFMVGRSGSLTPGSMNGNFILYCSTDGKKWDEGRYLRLRNAGIGAYSNMIVVGALDSDTPDRILIQTSHAYYLNQTNILHWWIDAYTSP